MTDPAPGPTYCEDCDYRLVENRNDPPWRWLCLRHKRLFPGFVSRTQRTTVPYAQCRDVNFGACPLWAPARTPPENEESCA